MTNSIQISKFQLMSALFTGGQLTVNGAHIHIVNRVEREDGSGHCFNVTGIAPNGQTVTAFVRTID